MLYVVSLDLQGTFFALHPSCLVDVQEVNTCEAYESERLHHLLMMVDSIRGTQIARRRHL